MVGERLSPLGHARRARDIGKLMLTGWLERQDTRLADALNPPEVEYPRFTDYVAEAPALTEGDLEVGDER